MISRQIIKSPLEEVNTERKNTIGHSENVNIDECKESKVYAINVTVENPKSQRQTFFSRDGPICKATDLHNRAERS